MNIFSAVTGGLPVGTIAKVVGALLVVAAIFGGGYKVGALATEHQMNAELKAVTSQLADEKEGRKSDQAAWEKAKAVMADAARAALVKSSEEARAKEVEAQAKIARINKDWADRVKRTKDEAEAALNRVLYPAVTTDPLDDGMWVDAWGCQATGGDPAASGANRMPQAAGGTATEPLRCRLHSSTASRLIKGAAEANALRNDYNACVDSLRVLSPQSFTQ